MALWDTSCVKRGRLTGVRVMVIAVTLVFATTAAVTAEAGWIQDQTGRKLWISDNLLRRVILAALAGAVLSLGGPVNAFCSAIIMFLISLAQDARLHNIDALVKSRFWDGFVKSSQARRANPEE